MRLAVRWLSPLAAAAAAEAGARRGGWLSPPCNGSISSSEIPPASSAVSSGRTRETRRSETRSDDAGTPAPAPAPAAAAELSPEPGFALLAAAEAAGRLEGLVPAARRRVRIPALRQRHKRTA